MSEQPPSAMHTMSLAHQYLGQNLGLYSRSLLLERSRHTEWESARMRHPASAAICQILHGFGGSTYARSSSVRPLGYTDAGSDSSKQARCSCCSHAEILTQCHCVAAVDHVRSGLLRASRCLTNVLTATSLSLRTIMTPSLLVPIRSSIFWTTWQEELARKRNGLGRC